MDLTNALFFLFAMVSTLYVTHIGFYLIGANFYDIWQFRRLSRRRKLREAGLDQWPFPVAGVPKSPNPLVTVAIPAHNETKVIGRCLDSVRQSRYRPVQVIVADDASRDCTKHVVTRGSFSEHGAVRERSEVREVPPIEATYYTSHRNFTFWGLFRLLHVSIRSRPSRPIFNTTLGVFRSKSEPIDGLYSARS